jgi:Zn-finger nucleic acid-binding protein
VLICSTCNIPLCRIEYEGVTVHVCPDCRGALGESVGLGTIVRRRERTWAGEEKRRIETQVLEAPVRDPYRCPRCLMKMQQMGMQMQRGRVVLDYCKPCRLYWFDRGELELAQILFEQQQDSQTPEEQKKTEVQASAEMVLKDEQARISGLPRGPDVAEDLGLEPEYDAPPQDPESLVRRVKAEQLLREHAEDVRFSAEVAKNFTGLLSAWMGSGI